MIKRDVIGLGGFIDMELTSNSVQNIVGVGCLSAEWYEIAFDIFVMMEPDYNMRMMSNFSGLT